MATGLPYVSVLMPAWNAADTIDEAVASIAAQTFADWKLVAIDDASTDGTDGALAGWAARDSRVVLVRLPVHLGIVRALNAGLPYVSGPVVARMDADDIAEPQRLERQVALLEAGAADVVGCGVRYFPRDAVAGGALRYEAWLNSLVTPRDHDRDLYVECPLAHPSLMLRTADLRAAGGYADRGWPEDYDLLMRLHAAGLRLAKVPEVLLHWREGPARASRSLPTYSLDAFRLCKAHYLRRGPLDLGRPALVFGAGPVGKGLARALLAEGCTLAGFVDLDPRKVGQRVYGLPVLSQSEGLALRGSVFGLAAVGTPGGRDDLRAVLTQAGWRECIDFRCAA